MESALNQLISKTLTRMSCAVAMGLGLLAVSGMARADDAQPNSEPCDAPWDAKTIYQGGEVVSYAGRNYTAAYWTQGNAPDLNSGDGNTGQPWRVGQTCNAVANVASGNPDANFSPATLQFLKKNTGLDGEQWNNIMKLINKPEQDSLQWTKYYGYCQNIHDDRGYTIGIFGATTGGSNDTGPDGPELFKTFDALSGAKIPSAEGGLTRIGAHGKMSGSILKISDSSKTFCSKVKAQQNNPTWREAMWRTFYNVDIQYSVQQARQRGFDSALTIGSFVDTALNQGADGGGDSLKALLARSGDSPNEKTFMTRFYAERAKVVDTHDYNTSPNGKNRVKQWSKLMDQGETDLKNADAAIVKVTNWQLH
ncbi:Chitosanase (EC 3.2.1.132) [Mycetohabitans rhizoxinica HKI 454]|uniref:Chitosanase n=1 Tax=Mycetohabitans rhizoxinica (strain DSM 19002 / CIP 109453 / HKI 454) TaxID=882378 RepID=E5AQ94_MYCRK|nr:chitosanase [Mycetohabitans sp. B6]CBW74776.1 Chitosanase (EC 3.2.1.132) [Mycetohabitans rhizoxinica HKI 454]